ncbi:MAG: SRPBCC family protein [Gemmatimonadaceae bacterium]
MTQTVAPVRRQVVVEASAEHAFRVFTEGVDRWWPREHHIGKSPMAKAILEPRAGGRWYAVSQDGSECDTGKVLVWEPPHRLVLAWQITATWQFDPDFVTEVEVTFTPQGDKKTLVVLEHRNLERYGAQAEGLRASLDAAGGWGKLLQMFSDAASEESAA